MKFLLPCMATACLLLSVACNTSADQSGDASKSAANAENTTPAAPPAVGSDSDSRGCKGSAGYQWSEVRQKCLRIFEDGIRLDTKADGLDPTVSAFVVFPSEKDDSKAELFMPNEDNGLVLTRKKGADVWANEVYTLSLSKGVYALENAQKITIYQGPAHK